MSDKYEMKDLGAEAAKARELLLSGDAFKTDTSVPNMPRGNHQAPRFPPYTPPGVRPVRELSQVGEKYFSRTRIDTEALSRARVDILPHIVKEIDHRLTEYIFKALREHGEVVVRLEQDAEIAQENPMLSTVTTSIKVAARKDVDGFLNQVAQILQWHKDACPSPKLYDTLAARACIYEEVNEYVASVSDTALLDVTNAAAEHYYNQAREGTVKADTFVPIDKKAHCDALCDLIVVALQDGYRSGYDMIGALGEVIASNESKRLLDGTFPRNDAGKIIKTSPTYFEADVTPFLGGSK